MATKKAAKAVRKKQKPQPKKQKPNKKPATAKAPRRQAEAAKGKSRAPKPKAQSPKPSPPAIPVVLVTTPTERRRAIERLGLVSPVVLIVDDPYPVGALRRFLEGVRGKATPQQGQIALGAAQLMLAPIAREHRGGPEVNEIVDMVLERWEDFPERAGFHAQEFLRTALAAVGIDRERINRLAEHVPPDATADLLFDVACAYATSRDKVAMLASVERALESGISPATLQRDPAFAVYRNDPGLATVLARAAVPPIPVDIGPYVQPVRSALDTLVHGLRELGERIELRPPVRLDAILDAERARKISLPNDYRALLTITNGMRLWNTEFFGVGDYRDATPLAVRALRYLQASASTGPAGIEDCVPLASWGQQNDWLLYDPRGQVRGDGPGYVLVLGADTVALPDLVKGLTRIGRHARETLATN
jgi:hypothetical protein